MKNREEVEALVKDAVHYAGGAISAYALDASLEDMGLDSLDTLEFVMELEQRLAIDIPDASIETWRTPIDVVEYICARLDLDSAVDATDYAGAVVDKLHEDYTSAVISKLYADAERLETEVGRLFSTPGNHGTAHIQAHLAQSLRVAASYLSGVEGA